MSLTGHIWRVAVGEMLWITEGENVENDDRTDVEDHSKGVDVVDHITGLC